MNHPPAPIAPGRRGLLAGGNFIVDHVKLIDQWPPQEALARISAESPHNGGGAYNVLKDLARLRAPFPLEAAGLVGADANGRWIRDDCAAHGIATSQLHADADAPTSYTDVMTVAATGRRTFFHQCGANARLAPGHFDFGATGARWFYLGYVLLLDILDAPGTDGAPAAAAVFRAARSAGLRTALDCVSVEDDRFRTVVKPVLPLVDVLFANDFEAEKLTGCSLGRGEALSRPAAEQAARRLVELGVRQCAIVHFPEGVCACSAGGETVWQPAVRVPPSAIAGATGAGDALAAGVLLGLHEDWPLVRALELGVCTAAASLRHASASVSVGTADECLALGRQWGFRPAP
jgi:sugar/nucleoside kinase (ribokinase family)